MDVPQTTSFSEEPKLESTFLCNVTSVCRICLSQDRMMKNIFGSADSESISDKILFCTGVKFSQEDGLSDQICTLCFTHLAIAHKFKTKCISADDICRKLLEDQKTFEVSTDVYAGATDDETKVEDDCMSEADNDFRDDEKTDGGFSEIEVKPAVMEMRYPGPKRKNKNRFRRLFCEICDVAFKTKAESVGHKNKMHKDNETYVCELCGKFFSNYKSHRSHAKSHREAVNACTVCDYKSPFKHSLKKHMWTHTGEKNYRCDLCSISFIHASSLWSHTRKKHSAERHRFPCPQCDKRFPQRNHLKRHLESHDPVKRHVCEVCNSGFTRRCYWRKHMLDKHNITIPLIKPPSKREPNAFLIDVLKEGQSKEPE